MKRVILLLLLLSISHFLFSQKYTPGYVVLSNGDTLKGTVYFKRSNEILSEVRLKSGDKIQSFSRSQIRSANNSTTTVFSHVVEMDMTPKGKESVVDTIFADLIVRGKLSLFQYLDRYKKNHFFMEDENGQWIELVLHVLDLGDGFHFQELPTYKGTLKKYFADCPTLSKDIERCIYEKNNLKKLFVKGLSCKYGQQSIKEVNQEKIQIDFGIVGGVNQTDIRFVDKSQTGYRIGKYSFNKSYNLTGGVYMDLKFPRINKIIFHSELLYKRYTNTAPEITESTLIQDQVTSNGYVNANYLKLNLSARYFFFYHKISPFISLGVSLGFLLSSTQYANVTTTVFTTSTYSQDPIMTNIASYESGAFAGLGITARNFGFEMRMELSSGLRPMEASSSVTSIYALLYYRWKKLQ